MYERWVSTDSFLPPRGTLNWDVSYAAHPTLDPAFVERPSRLRQFTRYTWDRIREDDAAYRREAARLLRPLRDVPDELPPCNDDILVISEYLQEADVYLYSAIDLLPADLRPHVLPVETVNRCLDLRDLLGLIFTESNPRLRFEAQRKLTLANLLLDIDHSRHVQQGPRHLAYFQEMLERTLWRYKKQAYDVEVGFRIGPDGESIEYTARPREGDQRWRFRSSFLERPLGGRAVALDILYASCRFKRSVEPVSFEVVDGEHRVLERIRWSEMRQSRSGSILSKMIRRGINNPDEIADILGAMFIVHDEEALDDLLTLLDEGLGNPFGWRNVTDTLGPVPAGQALNRYSGPGFRVFKGDVDVLVPSRLPEDAPYRFTVEIQIHTLESYLRTVCSAHTASHLSLKLRQFVSGLIPYLFPAPIYGKDWLRFENGD